MKKLIALLLAVAMIFALSACGKKDEGKKTEENKGIKIGVVLIGDENEGYTKAHMDGIKEAASALSISDDKIVWKYKVAEDSTCADKIKDLVGSGCNLIISNSYGHQFHMDAISAEFPDVQFVAMTGDFAAISGKANLKNAFTKVFESRYVSGVVAGLKIKELVDTKALTKETQPASFDKDGNIKIGYVGAFPYAEVISGYTAFYLGIRSVVENTVMEVNYTNSWFDLAKEGAAAESLVANGAVIIGQHADSTGAPAAVEKLNKDGKIAYSIGYNVDMRETAPTAALTSATNNWAAYYTYAFETFLKGEQIATNWSEGYAKGAVGITELNTTVAKGTKEYVADVEAKLKDGSLNVFDTSKFTVEGKKLETAEIDLSHLDFSKNPPEVVYAGTKEEAITDGVFEESKLRSAPYFSYIIDGVTVK